MSEMRVYTQGGLMRGGDLPEPLEPSGARFELRDYENTVQLSIRFGKAWVGVEVSKELDLPGMVRKALDEWEKVRGK